MKSKVKNQSTKTLKEMAHQLMNDFRDGADLVHELVMDELEKRMAGNEFINFCDEI